MGYIPSLFLHSLRQFSFKLEQELPWNTPIT